MDEHGVPMDEHGEPMDEHGVPKMDIPLKWLEYPGSGWSTMKVVGVPMQWLEYPGSGWSTLEVVGVPWEGWKYPGREVGVHRGFLGTQARCGQSDTEVAKGAH